MRLLALIVLGVLLLNQAVAAPLQLPSSVDPGRVSQDLTSRRHAPRTSPTMNNSASSVNMTIPHAEKIKFKIKKIIIKDATVFNSKTLLALFPHKMNSIVSVADIQTYVANITAFYRKQGYILSRAILPPQTIEHGIVSIQIVEGYIDKIKIEGNVKGQKFLKALSTKMSLCDCSPLNMKQMERYVLIANDIPGMSSKVLLVPSLNLPGAAEITMINKQSKFMGYVSFDNRSTRFLGPNEITVGATVNGWLTGIESTGIRTLVSSDGRALRYFDFFHDQLLNDEGLRLKVDIENTRTRPGFILAPLNVVGASDGMNADFNYPIIRSRQQNLYVHAALNSLSSKTLILANNPLYNDRTRSLIIGTSYDFFDHSQGFNNISADLSKGFLLFGASSPNSILSQPSGRPNYSKFNTELSHTQYFKHAVSALVAIKGQYAFTSLLSAQQFGLGGVQFGRGYDPSEITGDHGLAGKIELRLGGEQTSVNILRSLQYFTFYEAGAVWNRSHASIPAKQSLASTGIGARLSINQYWFGSLEVDKPLTRSVASVCASGTSNCNEPRVFFSLTGSIS